MLLCVPSCSRANIDTRQAGRPHSLECVRLGPALTGANENGPPNMVALGVGGAIVGLGPHPRIE